MVHDSQVLVSVLHIRPETELVLVQAVERINESLTALKPPTASETLEIPLGEEFHAAHIEQLAVRARAGKNPDLRPRAPEPCPE